MWRGGWHGTGTDSTMGLVRSVGTAMLEPWRPAGHTVLSLFTLLGREPTQRTMPNPRLHWLRRGEGPGSLRWWWCVRPEAFSEPTISTCGSHPSTHSRATICPPDGPPNVASAAACPLPTPHLRTWHLQPRQHSNSAHAATSSLGSHLQPTLGSRPQVAPAATPNRPTRPPTLPEHHDLVALVQQLLQRLWHLLVEQLPVLAVARKRAAGLGVDQSAVLAANGTRHGQTRACEVLISSRFAFRAVPSGRRGNLAEPAQGSWALH